MPTIRGFRTRVARTVRRVSGIIDGAPALWVPPGHYYSPITDRGPIGGRPETGGRYPPTLLGIDLAPEAQLDLLSHLRPLAADRLYGPDDRRDVRYEPENTSFRRASATMLHLMLRFLRPRRLVEVGCGNSTAVILDTNQHYLAEGLDLILVEPDPARIEGVLRPTDRAACQIHQRPLQEVGVEPFGQLEDGDILFVDSTHVLKTGSDVHSILLDILPRLKPGVWVHFHDIYYPFEYPDSWIREGRSWNEAYALRAFLCFNQRFRIGFWTSYLYHHHRDALRSVPGLYSNGSSLWIRPTNDGAAR